MVLSVSELNEYVAGLLAEDINLGIIRVRGEISGFKKHSSGHLYFSLKDEAAIVRCVMFRQEAYRLLFRPQDGMQVTAGGRAALYVRDGQFQLYVKTMDRQGEGELYARFLKLKAQLEAEGYFEPARKRPLPVLPRCVGVVTSGSGAALHDIVQIIRRRFPNMHIQHCPVAVQGEGAAEQIAAAIRRLNALNEASVLIVGRGGGSMEDLWAFNERVVADAIFESALPVISAVGHETDFTIADFVADMRAPTPSAAAELCVPEYDALLQSVDMLYNRLVRAPAQGIQARRERLRLLMRGFSAVGHSLALKKQMLLNERERLAASMRTALTKKRGEVEKLTLRLEARAPARLLQGGYALVCGEDGRPLTSAGALRQDMPVTLRMQGGEAGAVVREVRLDEG